METKQWTVDECQDARGFATIRPSDGSDNGDIESPCIATVYDWTNARLIAAAPDLLAQLNAFVEFANEWFGEKMPEDWRGRCVCANAAIDKAAA